MNHLGVVVAEGRQICAYYESTGDLAWELDISEQVARSIQEYLDYGDDVDLANVYPLRGKSLSVAIEFVGFALSSELNYTLESWAEYSRGS